MNNVSVSNLKPQNSYSWKLEIFDWCDVLKEYRLITLEVNKWTPNCAIYNMILGRISTLLNLAKQEIDKVNNKLDDLNVDSLIVSVSIMNAAQYLRYSIESIVSQLVNNNVEILSKNIDKIKNTWRIKSIFNVLNDNNIDWAIKEYSDFKYLDNGSASMPLTKKHKFNVNLINNYFEYLSDILHDKHILHKKNKMINAKNFEEYKQKVLEAYKKDINKLNLIHKDIYEILSNHSLLLENGRCVVVVKNFMIETCISNKLFLKFSFDEFELIHQLKNCKTIEHEINYYLFIYKYKNSI